MLDWRVIIELVGMAGSVGIILWKLGSKLGTIQTLVTTYDMRISKLETKTTEHGEEIAALKAVGYRR